jgi:hypothetical protein
MANGQPTREGDRGGALGELARALRLAGDVAARDRNTCATAWPTSTSARASWLSG